MKLFANKNAFILGVLMLLAFVAAEYLKPIKKLVESLPAVSLEQMIPDQFGEWRDDKAQMVGVVDPGTKSALDKIYGQTLTRIYLNPQGERIMLSIAYGGDQSKEFEVHRPEVCYAAQGFQILRNKQDALATKFGVLPVKRIFTSRGSRVEPITYWIMVGEEAAVGIKVKLAQVRYGLTGAVPDGMLVRVSSISADENSAYPIQDQFIREMLASLSTENRTRLVGKLAVSQ